MAQEGPLVSIIVATFNRGPFLERCLRSILDQSYQNLECWVIDGASNDQSLEILRRLQKQDSRLKFISEPDAGEVYAVNKGLDWIEGEILGFQASDDFYVPDAVERSVQFLLAHPEFAGVSGDARYVDPSGRPLGRGMITYRGEMSEATIKSLLMRRPITCFLVHGAFFGWRDRILKTGKFDPAFSVTPDVEFYLRVLKSGERLGCLARMQVNYTVHPDMGAVKFWEKVEAQLEQLRRQYGLNLFQRFVGKTGGRAYSYFSNPYRSPFLPGVIRELQQLLFRGISKVKRRFGRSGGQ